MRRETREQYARVAKQVKRTRELYSQIGEPLPVDIIIDLHLHLAPALEAAKRPRRRGGKRRLEA